jgi:hypothetical protein
VLLNKIKKAIFVLEMKKGLATYNKFIIALLLVLVGHIAFGTGLTEKSSKSNFSLKNLNSKTKAFSLVNLKR